MSIDISVSVEGTIPNPNFSAAVNRANKSVGKQGIRGGRAALGTHRRSGSTGQNLRFRQRGDDVEWYDGVPQALFLEEGTGLYGPTGQRIRPKKAKALRWVEPGGDVVFAKSVKGIKPIHWLENGINRSVPLFERYYTDQVIGELD